jgi:hypothetical protein
MTEAFDALGELAVAPAFAVIDESELAGAAGIEIALENIGGEIVFARDRFNPALAFCLNMIFSENRFPPRIKSGAGFFRIMLWRAGHCPPLAHATHYAVDGIRPQPCCQTCCQDKGIAL